MSIAIRTLGPEDADLVLGAELGLFDHTPQGGLTAEFLRDPRHHLVGAADGDRLIGFVSAVHYVHPDKPVELWINEVAVAPNYREQGIGCRMIEMMLALGRQLGCGVAWVLTDRANLAAMRLYARSSGVENPVPAVMFEFPLR